MKPLAIVSAITWTKDGGGEFAVVELASGSLHASGVAVGAQPLPYRLDYELACGDGYVTRRLSVRVQGGSWQRHLDLTRDSDGTWHVDASSDGNVNLPAPGGDPSAFAGALDCDLGLCPVTNTMPVLRHGMLDGGEPREFLMAWVSVPDLSVRPSVQKYTFIRHDPGAGSSVINYASGTFSADVTFDPEGLVIDYPGLATRADAERAT